LEQAIALSPFQTVCCDRLAKKWRVSLSIKPMNLLKSSFFWFFCFTLLFFLALDFWSWEEPTSFAWLGLPGWVFYFMGLQLLLSFVLLIFSITYWQSDDR